MGAEVGPARARAQRERPGTGRCRGALGRCWRLPAGGGGQGRGMGLARQGAAGQPYQAAASSTARSISILMSLPTSQPPVSMATFQVRPKSSRLILEVAWKPARLAPAIDL